MRKLTTLVGDKLLVLKKIIVIEIIIFLRQNQVKP